ncbi:MAG: hypothetical protein IIA59_11975 [Candidatus Marinimicrobia bacterium]|nr:hypothetical protein [Candidatus Neomarinimicrobiota bacterium]
MVDDYLMNRVSDEDLRKAYSARFSMKMGEVLTGSQQVADHLQAMLAGRTRETVVVIFLDARNAFIGSEICFEGTVTQAVIFPREIVKVALLKNAASLILGHNHPSGQTRPSTDDQEITRKLKRACELVDIPLLDHVIVGDGYFSFADQNIL